MARSISKLTTKYLTYLGWPILIIGFLVTGIATYYVFHTNREEDRLRFANQVEEAMRRVQYRMERYESVLIQTRAFFLSSKNVDRKEFKQYFLEARIFERFPGIQGLGYVGRADRNTVRQLEIQMRMDVPSFKVWPDQPRENYFPILFIEPIDSANSKVLGYDMFTEPVRREAMLRSWETGLPAISGKIVLIQSGEEEPQPGFNYYVPYYKVNEELGTIEQRRKNLIGFIYSPFRANNLFTTILAGMSNSLDIEIFDGPNMSEFNLLFDINNNLSFTHDSNQKLKLIKRTIIGGRTFTFYFVPSGNFDYKQSPLILMFIAIAGVLITLLIYRIFWITKRQAEESRASENALQDALKSRDDFLSIASHELKTPLTTLKLQTQLTQKALDKHEDLDKLKGSMQTLATQTDRQTKRLIRLVDDMLDISRIRTGRLSIEKEIFDLNDLVRDVVSHMHDQFSKCPGGEPVVRYSKEARGRWDKIRIEQVISNLLTNAIKYGRNQLIEIDIISTEKTVTLKVKDYGMGIAPSSHETIFDRFDRGSVGTNEISGLGLGLFITKQIVTAHQGKIWVESDIGKGATFIVELPRYVESF